jgi:hypothetical protein
MQTLKKLLLPVVAAFCLASAPVSAWASPADDAEVYIQRGLALRKDRNDAAAVQEFRRAYEILPGGRSAAQLGLAERQVKNWVDADRHLAEALRDRTDPWIRKNRSAIEIQQQTVARHVGRVVVGGEPSGADVFLNGQSVGTVPLREPATVAPGPVRVDVRAPGHISTSMSIVVAAGDLSRVEVRLERERTLTPAGATLPGPLATAPLPSPTLPSGRDIRGGPVLEPTPEREPVETVDRQADSAGPSPGLRTARWVALGATGVFLATGITGLIIHEHEVGVFNKLTCGVDAMTGNVINRPNPNQGSFCRKLVDNASTGRTVGIVGLAGAGLLAVTSAVLFLAF